MFFADLERFVINGYLQRSRGASCFAVDWQKLRGDIGCKRELRVCVSVKKRLQIYQFKNETFELVKVSGWTGTICEKTGPKILSTVGPVLNAWSNDCVLWILPTLRIY